MVLVRLERRWWPERFQGKQRRATVTPAARKKESKRRTADALGAKMERTNEKGAHPTRAEKGEGREKGCGRLWYNQEGRPDLAQTISATMDEGKSHPFLLLLLLLSLSLAGFNVCAS